MRMRRLVGKLLKRCFNPANLALSQAYWNDEKEPAWARAVWRFYMAFIPERMKAWW